VLLCLIILNILSLPLTSVLNGLVIITVKTKPRLKTTSNVALACLATTDCVMGVIGQPFFAVQLAVLLQGERSSSYCTLLAASVYVIRVLGAATFLHLTVINIERYIAIKHSLKYKILVTRGRLFRGSAFAYTVLLCLIILNILSLPLTSVLNGLVIITVKTKPRLKTTSNVALACLATTDCVMGVIGQPFFAVQLAVLLQGRDQAPSVYVIRVLGAATFLHLTVINIERYIAIKHSLKYKILVTRGRLFRGSAFVWVVSFL
ncbi:unnamed protein product, partial [Porites lobata]